MLHVRMSNTDDWYIDTYDVTWCTPPTTNMEPNNWLLSTSSQSFVVFLLYRRSIIPTRKTNKIKSNFSNFNLSNNVLEASLSISDAATLYRIIQAASYVMFSDVGSKDSSGANGKRCFCWNGKTSGGIERRPRRYNLMFKFVQNDQTGKQLGFHRCCKNKQCEVF